MIETLNIVNDNESVKSAVGSDVVEVKETTQVVVSEEPASILSLPLVPANDNHPTLPSDEIALPVVDMGESLNKDELLALAVQTQDPQNLLASISGPVNLNEVLNQLAIPQDANDLAKYIMKEGAVVGSFIRLDCKKNQSKLGDAYKKLVQGGQYCAIKLLLAKFFIGQQLLHAGSQRGKRDKTAKQAIADLYGLGSRQARDYQKLVWEKILEVITKSLEADEIPTVKDCLGTTRHTMKDDWTRSKTSWNPIVATTYKTLELDEPLNVGDICACIGSGTSKLKDIKVHCKVALEVDPQRMDWHKLVHPECVSSITGDVMNADVQKEFIKAFRENNCRVLSFSCPCQTSSLMNTSKNKGKDVRSRIIKSVLDIVDELNPEFILSENVPEWLTNSPECCQDFLQGKTIWEYFKEREESKYNLNVGVFNAADYNTAENSVRGIVLGVRKEIAPIWEFPKPQEIRTTFMDVCGDLKSLKSGEVDPKVSFHYERGELEAHEIAFIERTPTGCSAWDNPKQFQPQTKAKLLSGASFGRGFSRNEWGKPVRRITSASGAIGDVNSLHPGRPLSEENKYSDPRVLSIREVMRCIGLDDSFPIPCKLQENKMLSKTDEAFVRECLGEHFCPNHVNALYSTLPVQKQNNLKGGI